MTRQDLLSMVVNIDKLVNEYGDKKFDMGLSAIDIDPRRYDVLSDRAVEIHGDIIDALSNLIYNVSNYLPFEEKGVNK